MIALISIFVCSLKQEIVFESDKYESISALLKLENGNIVGGTRISTILDQGSRPAIIFSKDNGKTWKEINVAGITDSRTYGLSSHLNVVVAGRGDLDNPCIIISEDYGETWNVAMDTKSIQRYNKYAYSIYATVYDCLRGKFLAFISPGLNKSGILESKDGKKWSASSLYVPGTVRNAYVVGNSIYACSHTGGEMGLYVLKEGSNEFVNILPGYAVSTMKKLNNGNLVASSWKMNHDSSSLGFTSAKRINNMLYLYVTANSISAGQQITISTNPNSKLSSYYNTNLKVIESTSKYIVVKQEGIDFEEEQISGSIFRSTSDNTIHLSQDDGNTWEIVHTHKVIGHPWAPAFSRTFFEADNTVFVSLAGWEDDPRYAGCGVILESKDNGKHWEESNEIRGKNGARLNALYREITLDDGSVLITGQYFSPIIKLH